MKKDFLYLSAALAMALGTTACNTDYNFDNLSLEVTVGDTEGITIPMGSTGTITVASLLEGNEIDTDQDGFYSYTYADQLSYTVDIGTIEPFQLQLPTINPVVVDLTDALSTNIPTIDLSTNLNLPSGITEGMIIPEGSPLVGIAVPLEVGPEVLSETFSVELPSQVKSIQTITLGQDGNGSKMEVTFALGGLEDITTNRTLEEFYVELPAGFELDKDSSSALSSYATVEKGEGSTTNNRFAISNYPMTDANATLSLIVKSIDVSALTPTDGKLDVDVEITYGFSLDASTKAGSLGSTMPSINASAEFALDKVTILTNQISHKIEFKQSIAQSVELPKEVERIDYISVATPDGSAPTIDLKLAMAGAPVEQVVLKDLSVELPDYIHIDAPEGWTLINNTLSRQSLTLDNDATTNILSLSIKGIQGLSIANSKAVLDGQVNISVTASLDEGQSLTIDPNEISHVSVTPLVEIDTIAIQEVTGIINPDFDEFITPVSIDITELTSALAVEGLDLDLNLASPTINIDITNPVGVALELRATLTAYKGEEQTASLTTPTLRIEAANGTQPTITNIILSGDQSDQPNVTTIKGLMDMINSLPDKIIVDVELETDKSKPHTLLLQDSYNFVVSYGAEASLKFNAENDGHISYTTVVEGIDLTDIMEEIDIVDMNSVTLHLSSISSLPVDLAMTATFLDEERKPIKGLTCTTSGVLKGNSPDTPSTCNVKIDIAPPYVSSDLGPSTVSELLSTIRNIECNFSGTTLAGGGLKPTQSIKADMYIVIDSGVTIDLESLVGTPEDETPAEGEGQGDAPAEGEGQGTGNA